MDYAKAITLTEGRRNCEYIESNLYICFYIYHVSFVLYYIYASFNML